MECEPTEGGDHSSYQSTNRWFEESSNDFTRILSSQLSRDVLIVGSVLGSIRQVQGAYRERLDRQPNRAHQEIHRQDSKDP